MTSEKRKRSELKNELSNRSAVSALTMHSRMDKSAAELCAEYIRNETISKRLYRPKMHNFVITELLEKFVKGHINLMPNGQRPILKNASVHLVHDILFCNVMPASMLYNRNTMTGVYDVSDGLQRTTKILGAMLGIFPVKTLDDRWVYLCSPTHEKGWRTLRDSPSTPDCVKDAIDRIVAIHDAPPTGEIIVENELRFELASVTLSVQVVENWPPRAAACLAQLQSMSTMTHSVGETAYESTNELTMAVARLESEWMKCFVVLGVSYLDRNKTLFLHTLRGLACTLSAVTFVNKASDLVGFGDFMSSIFHFVIHDLPTGYEERCLVQTFLPRFMSFATFYKKTIANTDRVFRKWKPDMIPAMVYMLAKGESTFSNEDVYACMARIDKPRLPTNRGFCEWFQEQYAKNDNLKTSLMQLAKYKSAKTTRIENLSENSET